MIKPYTAVCCRTLGAAVFAFAATANAQNLIGNPDFATNLSGWTVRPNSTAHAVTHEMSDGSPAPPSMRITQTAGITVPDAASVSSNCMPVSSATSYDALVDTRINTAFLPTVHAIGYSDSACTTAAGPTFSLSNCSAVAGGWRRCLATGFSPTAAQTHMQLTVVANFMPSAQLPLTDLLIDNARFGPSGTVPVTLQSFGVD